MNLARTALALVVVALAGCVTQAKFGAQVEADSEVDFKGYKTYAFPENAHAESTSLAYSPEMVSRTQAVFARRLDAEGLRRVFKENEADLVVSYGITAHSGTEVRVVPMSWSRGHDTNVRLQSMDAYGMHDTGYDEVRVDDVTAGMLVLELWDNRAGRVAWRVWVTGEIKDDRNQNFAGLETALIEAFEKFPPPPKK